MNLAPLAQSADKKELFARLGINEQIHRDLLVRIPLYFQSLVAKTHDNHSRKPRPREIL